MGTSLEERHATRLGHKRVLRVCMTGGDGSSVNSGRGMLERPTKPFFRLRYGTEPLCCRHVLIEESALRRVPPRVGVFGFRFVVRVVTVKYGVLGLSSRLGAIASFDVKFRPVQADRSGYRRPQR